MIPNPVSPTQIALQAPKDPLEPCTQWPSGAASIRTLQELGTADCSTSPHPSCIFCWQALPTWLLSPASLANLIWTLGTQNKLLFLCSTCQTANKWPLISPSPSPQQRLTKARMLHRASQPWSLDSFSMNAFGSNRLGLSKLTISVAVACPEASWDG